jgi:hypothetical protein
MMAESSKVEWTNFCGRDAGAPHMARPLNALQRKGFPDDGWQIDAVKTALTINLVATDPTSPDGLGRCGISHQAQSAASPIAGELKWQV